MRNALELVHLKRENRELRTQLSNSRNEPTIIAQDAIMQRLLAMARQVAQTDTVDIRLITATHRHLLDEVPAGRFRQDLYYRLDVVGLHLPSLVERRDDIPLLAFNFLRKHAARMARAIDDIDPTAMAALLDYDYPGNIRELENIIECAVTLAQGEQLTIANLPPTLVEKTMLVVREDAGRLPTLAEWEADYIRYVLERSGQNRSRAAKVLGIDRVSLWRKQKKYGMEKVQHL